MEEKERRNIVAREVTHSWSPDGEVPDAKVVSALHVSGFHFYRTVFHHISLLFTPVKAALGLHKGNEAVFFSFFSHLPSLTQIRPSLFLALNFSLKSSYNTLLLQNYQVVCVCARARVCA